MSKPHSEKFFYENKAFLFRGFSNTIHSGCALEVCGHH